MGISFAPSSQSLRQVGKKRKIFAFESTIFYLQLFHVILTIQMRRLNPDLVADSKRLSVYLSTVVNLLSIRNWKFVQSEAYAVLKPGMHNLTINMFQELVQNGEFYEVMHQVLEAGLGRPGKVKKNIICCNKNSWHINLNMGSGELLCLCLFRAWQLLSLSTTGTEIVVGCVTHPPTSFGSWRILLRLCLYGSRSLIYCLRFLRPSELSSLKKV